MTTALLLAITLAVTTGTAARLTRLVTTDTLTTSAREALTDSIRGAHPEHRRYNAEFEQYRTRVAAALDTGDPVPTDAPTPPNEPLLVTLLHCRWCAGMWISLLVTLTARLILSTTVHPLWTEWPLGWTDLALIPAWALATSYAVGYLANHEQE